jgi:hypothetical protein
MLPDNDTAITWEQREYSPSAARDYSKLLEELEDEEFPDSPCSYHIEHVNRASPNDSVSTISDSVDPMSTVPELSVSESSSPSDDSSYDPWRDADDIPTRPASAFCLQDFPPLVRCREDPAMGHPEDIIILDFDDDPKTRHWQLWNINGDEGVNTQEWSRSSSFSCREVHACKDDETWPTISNEAAYGADESTLIGQLLDKPHTSEHLTHLI